MAFSNYNQYGFTPYNNLQPMVQPMMQQPQYQQQYQPMQQFNNQQYIQQSLQGQIVDSVEVVKAKDVDLNGNPLFYPNVNGQEIYKKQLMPDGTSKISTYKIVEGVENEAEIRKYNIVRDYITVDKFTDSLNSFKSDIVNEIKNMFL